MNSAPFHSYPDCVGRIVLLAMEEILGSGGVKLVLDLAHLPGIITPPLVSGQEPVFSLEQAALLQTALESAFGTQAGRGLAQRVGRTCLKYGLREFGSSLGVTGQAFRLLPLPARMKVGSESLVGLFNQFTGQHVRLEFEKRYITWHIEHCPLCRERQADVPCCTMLVGFFQEALYWVSGGKYYLVEEKKCIACGDSECTIVIDQTPMS
jgi:predicted hydrocarbon binding protein